MWVPSAAYGFNERGIVPKIIVGDDEDKKVWFQLSLEVVEKRKLVGLPGPGISQGNDVEFLLRQITLQQLVELNLQFLL